MLQNNIKCIRVILFFGEGYGNVDRGQSDWNGWPSKIWKLARQL